MRCPVHRRFLLIRSSPIDGSPVLSSISSFVTLSIQVILMIETHMSHQEGMQRVHLSPVHCPSLGSAQEGGQHDYTIYLAFNPRGHMVDIPESLAYSAERCISNCYPPLYFIVNGSITWFSASEVDEFENRVQRVSINHDILLSDSCRVGMVQHIGPFDVNLQAELLSRNGESIHCFLHLFSRVCNQCTVICE